MKRECFRCKEEEEKELVAEIFGFVDPSRAAVWNTKACFIEDTFHVPYDWKWAVFAPKHCLLPSWGGSLGCEMTWPLCHSCLHVIIADVREREAPYKEKEKP